jgi:predicted dehydrogenase
MAGNFPPLTRRDFHKTGAASLAGAVGVATAGALRAAPSNQKRLAFIGVGNRGGQLLTAFLEHPDASIVALCDVYEPYLRRARERLAGKAETYDDFRRVLDRKDIDAVVIATPDHWHAIQTILACQSGKDVYVEKPLAITIREGRRMVDAARKANRVVQVGTHRRSSSLYADLVHRVAGGELGKVTVARTYRLSNMYPDGIGKAPPGPPPAGLNWEMWLGPREERPFQATIAPYKFRWWQAYSSQMGNWGVHYLDAIRWVLGEEAPASVSAHGGRFALDDDRTVPDTLEVIFEFASGRLAMFGQYEASGNPALRSGEIEFRGTLGTAYTSEGNFEFIAERAGQFQKPGPRTTPLRVTSRDGDLTAQHARNFLDCIVSRARPNADVEIGHRSTTFSHLANIALATRARLDWDAKAERVTNHPAANDLLDYEYREPWRSQVRG